MILSRSQMLEAETTAFARGVRAEDLMEIAGSRLADMVRQFHPVPGACRVFAGKGHNGGDVFVAARHLGQLGWQIQCEDVYPDSQLAPLTANQLKRLPRSASPSTERTLVVLDGLLGIGAVGAPRNPVLSAIEKINTLRAAHGAWVLSADIPSGLNADTGEAVGAVVRADATLAMGFAKTGLVADSATEFVGRLAIASLPDVHAPHGADRADVSTAENWMPFLPPRSFETHKGMCGRVAIVAGSRGYTGAARLCSESAVLGGAGLVTLFVPEDIYPILAASVVPEVMVQPVSTLVKVLDSTYQAIAIGPGLGASRRTEILEIIRSAACPCVIDADALNAVADGHLDLLEQSNAPCLLTPHPGEMERLFPRANRTRRQWLESFVSEYPVTLLLKGARTVIGEKCSSTLFNTTGHPGMASGGMGDVLTGVCSALIAQGKSPYNAAAVGAWVCGRAAELAITAGQSQESLHASAVLHHLGLAFKSLSNASL